MSGDRPGRRSTDQAQEQRQARLAPRPAPPELIRPEAPPDIPQDEDRDDDVIERPEDRDELRDEVDRAQQPHEEPAEREANTERRRAIGEDVPDEAEDIGNDRYQVPQPDVTRSDEPEDPEEYGPHDSEAEENGDDRGPVHGPSMVAGCGSAEASPTRLPCELLTELRRGDRDECLCALAQRTTPQFGDPVLGHDRARVGARRHDPGAILE